MGFSTQICTIMSMTLFFSYFEFFEKKMSKNKLREAHENDKFRKWKERQWKKLMTLGELNEKRRKNRE